MQSSDRNDSGILSMFIVGGIVGATFALLFAPRPGSQMRRRLRDYAVCAKDEVGEVVDHGAKALDSIVERGHEFIEKGQESLCEAARHVKGFAEAGREAVHETRDKLMSQQR